MLRTNCPGFSSWLLPYWEIIGEARSDLHHEGGAMWETIESLLVAGRSCFDPATIVRYEAGRHNLTVCRTTPTAAAARPHSLTSRRDITCLAAAIEGVSMGRGLCAYSEFHIWEDGACRTKPKLG